MDVETLILAKKYADEVAEGIGFIKGSPCTISSITEDEEQNQIVTFEWEDKDGHIHTEEMKVLKGKNIPNNILDVTKTDLNECIPENNNSVGFFRVGNNAQNSPMSESLIVQTSLFEDSGNVRITQTAYVNYNRTGNPQFIRTGIGSSNSITWSEWSKVANASDIDNSIMEFGSCTTYGNIRTVTLKKNYQRMKFFDVNYINFNALPVREATFKAPNTVTFKINDVSGNTFTANLTMNYMFVGE